MRSRAWDRLLWHFIWAIITMPLYCISLSSTHSFLRLAVGTPDCEAVYLNVAHMTVVSSAALLHTLLFGDHDEIIDARNRLYSNFEILLKLKPYWPGVDLMVCFKTNGLIQFDKLIFPDGTTLYISKSLYALDGQNIYCGQMDSQISSSACIAYRRRNRDTDFLRSHRAWEVCK